MNTTEPTPAPSTVTPAVILGGLAIFNGGMESLLNDLQHGDPSAQARAEDALRKVGVYGLPLAADALYRSQDVAFGLRLLGVILAQGSVGMNSLTPYLASLMAHDRDARIRDVVLRAVVDSGAERIAREIAQQQAAEAKKAARRQLETAAAGSTATAAEASVAALPE